MTRLFAVFILLASAILQAPSAVAGEHFDHSVIEVSMGMHAHGAENSHAPHHSSNDRHLTPSHFPANDTSDDCGIHCVSALPQILVPQTSVPIVLAMTFATFEDDIAGLPAPTLERPPRA